MEIATKTRVRTGEFKTLMFQFDRERLSLPRQKALIAAEMHRLELTNPNKNVSESIRKINEIDTQTGKRVHTVELDPPLRPADPEVVAQSFSIKYKNPATKVVEINPPNLRENETMAAVESVGSLAVAGGFAIGAWYSFAGDMAVGVCLAGCGAIFLENAVSACINFFRP